MEIYYESNISFIQSNINGTLLLIGTVGGTLGILNIIKHTYNTIIRSHILYINNICKRNYSGEEFATCSIDGTIRIWDLITSHQKYEFLSQSDQPKVLSYHPYEYIIACGFSSGIIRIFDIQSTSMLCELKDSIKNKSIEKINYFIINNNIYFISININGLIIIYLLLIIIIIY